jgi:hypothetical protein
VPWAQDCAVPCGRNTHPRLPQDSRRPLPYSRLSVQREESRGGALLESCAGQQMPGGWRKEGERLCLSGRLARAKGWKPASASPGQCEGCPWFSHRFVTRWGKSLRGLKHESSPL